MIIRIDEPSPSGIIVSALEIIEACLGIVVIASITEGVIAEYEVIARRRIYRTITPSVVGVRTHFRARFVIDSYDITLEIFLKKVAVEHAVRVAGCAIFQAYRCAQFVVEIDERILLGEALAHVEGFIHRFAYDTAAVQHILFSAFVPNDRLGHYFDGSYAIGVILERIAYIIVILKTYKLSALPCKRIKVY